MEKLGEWEEAGVGGRLGVGAEGGGLWGRGSQWWPPPQVGTHEELLRRGGLYAQLMRQQAEERRGAE